MRHEIILLFAMSKRLLFLLEARLIYPLIERFVEPTKFKSLSFTNPNPIQ